MKQIEIHLCGNPTILAGGEKVNVPYKKAEGFLYYLCVKKSVSREEVICLLWGDEDETTGKKKLRDAIYQVRRFLDKELLLTTGHTGISLNAEYPIRIDLDQIRTGSQEAEGLFLDHFFIKNCYEFEEWVEGVREEQRQLISHGIRERLLNAREQGDEFEIQKCGNILIKNDPYNEELYYELMNLYAENGNYTMAIRLYYDLVKLFREELEMEPSQKTKELFHRVFNVKEHVRTENTPLDLPFIGRKKELYELSGFLDRSMGQKISCLLVGGEEGVGKSALLECGRKMAAGKKMITLYTVCYRQGVDFFLNPWDDIFQEIKQGMENGGFGRELPEAAEQALSQLLNERTGVAYQAIERLVSSLFQFLTRENRIVLAFDDIQWMDKLSFQLLNRLLFLIPPERLLLIGTYHRSSQREVTERLEPLVRRDYVKLLPLAPFSIEETEEILHKSLPGLDSEPEKRKKLYEATDGNAFFLKEMINLIHEKGYTLEKSAKTNFVIQARLSGISKEEKEVLDCMSVFPEKIRIEELELLMQGMDRLTLLKILEHLQENFLIQEVLVGWNVYYKFVHRIFQEYLYERQSNGKRQLYHRMLAEYYERQAGSNFSILPLVAYHYEHCHDQGKAYSYQIRYLKEFYTVLNENFPVLQAEASDFDGDFGVMADAEPMLRLAEDVIRLQDDTREIRQMKMEMHYIKGRYDIALGDYDSGVANIEKSILLARRLNAHKSLLACYKQQIFHGIQRDDLEKVAYYVEQGLACIGKEERDEYATFLRLRGWHLVKKQKYAMAKETLEKSLAIFEELEDGGGRYMASIAACDNYLGDIYRVQGQYDRALTCYREALQAGRGPVETNGIGQVYSSIGQICYLRGSYEEAIRYLEKARDCLERRGYRWGLERTEAYLAMACLKLGRLGEAREHYQRGSAISAKIGNPLTEQLLEKVGAELKG